jgi:diguanylate cyclase
MIGGHYKSGVKLNHNYLEIIFKLNFLLIFLLLTYTLPAEDSFRRPFILSNETGSVPISGHAEYYLEKEGTLTLEDVLSKEYTHQKEDLNFGLTDSAVWLRFSTKNQSSEENWILEFNIHKFYTVEVYTGIDDNQLFLTHSYSYTRPFNEREIKEPYLAFPIDIPEESELFFYIRVQSQNSLEIPLILHSCDSYFQKMMRMKSLYSTIYGILIAMLVYNIFIYFFLRDKNYLNYIAYVFIYTLYLSALNGYGANYLWPYIQGRWTTIFSAVFGGLSLGIGCYLTREFLQTRTRFPLGDKILKILTFSGLFLSIIIFIFKKFMISFIYGNLIGTIILLSIVIISFISFSRGYKPALYFLISYSTIIIAQVAYSLLSIGPFGDHFFLKNLNQYAPVFQMTLLSLSLSYRFHLMRIEKDEALASALRAETRFSEGLEEKVQERTRELKEANRKLESLSFVDSLSGLYNRRFFEKALQTEWKRHGRENLELSLIMCDIDHFKEYNDTAGHQAGDQCIREISRTLNDTARRESDVVARYGGEEFIIILPQTDSDEVKEMALRVKESIDSLSIPHPAYPGKYVTISLGISTMRPDLSNNQEMLIALADKALYKSKNEGRNRITYLEA